MSHSDATSVTKMFTQHLRFKADHSAVISALSDQSPDPPANETQSNPESHREARRCVVSVHAGSWMSFLLKNRSTEEAVFVTKPRQLFFVQN